MCDSYTLAQAERVWLISDTHFDHTNIIKYCDRPFASAWYMNHALGAAWNSTISKDDIVYFLGDMSFGRGSRGARWWLQYLNGRIVFIKGSHDNGVRPTSQLPGAVNVVQSTFVCCEDLRFHLVHEPYKASLGDNHVIHGHVHNNRPLLTVIQGRCFVNVSVEAINYKPISLSSICRRVRRELRFLNGKSVSV